MTTRYRKALSTRKLEALEAWADGFSCVEIAKKLCVSKRTVYRWLREWVGKSFGTDLGFSAAMYTRSLGFRIILSHRGKIRVFAPKRKTSKKAG